MYRLHEESTPALKTPHVLHAGGEPLQEDNAAVLECQNCRRTCKRISWVPEYEIEMCDTCRDEAMVLDQSMELPCAARLELANQCASVKEFSEAFRTHMITCVNCSIERKAVQGDRVPLSPAPTLFEGKVA